jgi:hypothetical protein
MSSHGEGNLASRDGTGHGRGILTGFPMPPISWGFRESVCVGMRALKPMACPRRPTAGTPLLMPSSFLYPSLAGAILWSSLSTRSHGVTPYSPDGDTVFLFHLNEAAGASTAGNLGFSGYPGITTDGAGATVTDVFTGASGRFGNAAGLSSARAIGIDFSGNGTFTTAGADRFPLSTLLGADNAFTVEALVKPNTGNFSGHGEIWCADSDVTNNRGFQFRINSSEELEYNGLNFGGGNIKVSLAGKLQADVWYHAALTYTEAGQTAGSGLFTMYWTPVEGDFTEAQVLHSWNSNAITPGFTSQLVLGNEGRGPMSEGFPGLIDEARVSRIARAAGDFIFAMIDVDLDGLPDSWEQQIIDADSNDAITSINHVLPSDDFDSDTLTNLREYQLDTDPTVVNNPDDADGDGLPDIWELSYFATIWTQDASADPDYDTFNNLQEYQRGSNPLVFNNPNDGDMDGLPDDWEMSHLGSLTHGPEDDPDGDGFGNLEELNAGTDPDDMGSVPGDSDGNGLQDLWEMDHFAAIGNSAEDDPDGDSFDHAAEQTAGSDPNDPLDYPGAPAAPARPGGPMVDLLAFPRPHDTRGHPARIHVDLSSRKTRYQPERLRNHRCLVRCSRRDW